MPGPHTRSNLIFLRNLNRDVSRAHLLHSFSLPSFFPTCKKTANVALHLKGLFHCAAHESARTFLRECYISDKVFYGKLFSPAHEACSSMQRRTESRENTPSSLQMCTVHIPRTSRQNSSASGKCRCRIAGICVSAPI